ncbi:MAG: hypothetical protein ACRDZY_17225, partial [Acidimicrobiales bacterium]
MTRTRTQGRIRLLAFAMALAGVASLWTAVAVSAYTAPGSTLTVAQGCPTANKGASCTVIFHLQTASG